MGVVVRQAPEGTSVPLDRRLTLLSKASGFGLLDRQALDRLAAWMSEVRYEAGAVIVAEGDRGDSLYVIERGRAEVSAKGASRPLPLGVLDAGEVFGEIALLSPGGVRQATVTALTPLCCLVVAEEHFRQLLDEHPSVRDRFQRAADDLLEAKFLKAASPFTKLTPERLRWLSQQVAPLTVAAGDTIIRQGEIGDACYLIKSGRVEVLLQDGTTPERRLATMGRGALFGEAALLTDAPRSATVRALEPTILLTLRRGDLIEAMGAERMVLAQVVELVQLRARPAQVPGIVCTPRTNPDGEIITILKNPAAHTYFRLSPQGWFIWQRLDGRRSLRDLALDYMGEYKSFAPQAIAETIGGLTSAGFVATKSLRTDVLAQAMRLAWWQRAILGARTILEWQWSITGIDAWLSGLYRSGVRVVYTRAAQVALAVVSLAGLVAFIGTTSRASAALHTSGGARLLLFLIPAYLFSIVIHEAGHAFTTKAFGYEVPRAGIGWYWFGPIAFVDTSDMWLAGRWPRIAVSLAGPYSNVVLAGLAAIGGWFSGSGVATAALWQFAATSYLMVLFNLNPLLESDGYYVLTDWLERPNLRGRALAWLGQEMPAALRASAGLRGHGLDLVFGIASLAYILLMGALTLVCCRLFLQGTMARMMPSALAAGLAWALGVGVVALSLLSVAGELRGKS